MIIYKSDDLAKWTEVMASDIDGTRFHGTNPRTGEIDQVFEFNRTASEILQELNICPAEMFDYIWQLQETYQKIDDVNKELRIRYDLSRIEAQNLQIYLHLNLPKRETGHPVRLETWKKYRDREIIFNEFYEDVNSGEERVRVCSDDYIMKDLVIKGKINFAKMFEILAQPKLANIIANCQPVKKVEV